MFGKKVILKEKTTTEITGTNYWQKQFTDD